MKKVLLIIIAALLTLSICACTASVSETEITPTSESKKEISQDSINKGMPQFYYAKSVDELLNWIKTADIEGDDYARKHFLDVARQSESILTVDTKHNGYVLNNITVNPDNEDMFYQFIDEKDKNNAIYVRIILPAINDSQEYGKETQVNSKQSFDKTTTMKKFKEKINKKNEELENLYLDAPQYKEKTAKIEGEDMPLYYYNGKDSIEKGKDELRLLFTTARFETGNAQVVISLHGTYPNGLFYEEWDNKYLDFFKFKTVRI